MLKKILQLLLKGNKWSMTRSYLYEKGWWEAPTQYISKFNWGGLLPDKVTWKWAAYNVPLHPHNWFGRTVISKTCPHCNADLVHEAHDWLNIGEGGQYQVILDKCPNGHGAHIEWM